MQRKGINMKTWNQFKAGREDGSIICPSACPHKEKKGCPIKATLDLCWNSYQRWAGEKE